MTGHRMQMSGSDEKTHELRIQHVDQDLTIMDKHDDLLRGIDQAELLTKRKAEREIRDTHLHSITRARKHLRIGQKNAP